MEKLEVPNLLNLFSDTIASWIPKQNHDRPILGVAQLVECLPWKQEVVSSSLTALTITDIVALAIVRFGVAVSKRLSQRIVTPL